MEDNGARYLTVRVGIYKNVKGGSYNDLCGNGLELETSLRMHV